MVVGLVVNVFDYGVKDRQSIRACFDGGRFWAVLGGAELRSRIFIGGGWQELRRQCKCEDNGPHLEGWRFRSSL